MLHPTKTSGVWCDDGRIRRYHPSGPHELSTGEHWPTYAGIWILRWESDISGLRAQRLCSYISHPLPVSANTHLSDRTPTRHRTRLTLLRTTRRRLSDRTPTRRRTRPTLLRTTRRRLSDRTPIRRRIRPTLLRTTRRRLSDRTSTRRRTRPTLLRTTERRPNLRTTVTPHILLRVREYFLFSRQWRRYPPFLNNKVCYFSACGNTFVTRSFAPSLPHSRAESQQVVIYLGEIVL